MQIELLTFFILHEGGVTRTNCFPHNQLNAPPHRQWRTRAAKTGQNYFAFPNRWTPTAI